MKIDNTGRIVQFAEKPKGPDLKAMVVSPIIILFFMSSNILILYLIKIPFGLLSVDMPSVFKSKFSSW